MKIRFKGNEYALSYKQSLKALGYGFVSLVCLLCNTFCNQTMRLVTNHYLYVASAIAVMAFQIRTIAVERIERDKDSITIYQLQHELDSINQKHVKYYSFRR